MQVSRWFMGVSDMVVGTRRGEEVLDFAIAFDLMIANTFFCKRQSHLVTFSSDQYSSYNRLCPYKEG